MGRVCNGPRVLWAEFVMGRDVPEPIRVMRQDITCSSKIYALKVLRCLEKNLLGQINSENTQIESNWKYKRV